MKEIKLSGREMAVLRAIDYAVGSTGEEIRERTQIGSEDVADILNSLCEVGYVEVFPYREKVSAADFSEARFEINPSYSQELKAAMRRR